MSKNKRSHTSQHYTTNHHTRAANAVRRAQSAKATQAWDGAKRLRARAGPVVQGY